MEPFVETDCTITHEGRSFTSGGACIIGDRAIVYVLAPDGSASRGSVGNVTTWHGEPLGRYESVGQSRGFAGCKLIHYRVRFADGSRWRGKGLGAGMMLRLHACK